ncbi:MAG: HAMP domain-containing histidine kinase [Deltaproteobacteria bacterium]|nr:HAMP domain-containing histidine kinase [Deltaproteobacteria bacterium]MBW2151213.1 HAMP domain-containing histidine kinase [Deltaproteobacteria bacterium]
MSQDLSENKDRGYPREIEDQKRVIFRELRERTQWFIRLRWFVPPGIVVGAVVAVLLGFEKLPIGILFIMAASILAYNILFYLVGRNQAYKVIGQRDYVRNLTRWQFGLDYIAMFLLIHFTGGVTSPLIFFFIFHIIFASILLPPRSSYGFASLVAAGMIGIAFAEYLGWISPHPIIFQSKTVNLFELPAHMMAILGFFTASVYITAFCTSSIMGMVRKRISNLVELSEAFRRLNDRLNALYVMNQAIGSVKKLDQVLKIVTSELCHVMGVLGISVKLLSEDGKFLHYVAAEGLVADVFKSRVVEVAKSPLNRQVVEGKSFVTGRVTQREMFQFGEDLAAANVQSVLFVPLTVEDKVIGILGAYCKYQERFSQEEVDFFRQAAGLVAVAIENARSYEAIEKLMNERSWFMMRVAHNLRSPLAAIVSILDVVRGGYQGELTDAQSEYLRRVHRRARTMISMINELLMLAQNRDEKRKRAFNTVDLKVVAGRIQRTFQDEALQKGLKFDVVVSNDLPTIQGDADMIEQALENLVSNAINYTPAAGTVRVEFSKGPKKTVQIQVSDTGIGIPKDARPRLFDEFFRAENAKSVVEHGTGLGLPIVKEIVARHGGRIIVESEEGLGSLFVVQFPVS